MTTVQEEEKKHSQKQNDNNRAILQSFSLPKLQGKDVNIISTDKQYLEQYTLEEDSFYLKKQENKDFGQGNLLQLKRKDTENEPIERKSSQCNKTESVKSFWTEKEDEILVSHIKINGSCNFINCILLSSGRTIKQCKERWINVLNPRIQKGDWLIEEDYLIFKLYTLYGGKWSKFVSYFQGSRSENTLKNRFNSTIRKYSKAYAKRNAEDLNPESLKMQIHDELKSKLMGEYNLTSEDEIDNFLKSNFNLCDTAFSKSKETAFTFYHLLPQNFELQTKPNSDSTTLISSSRSYSAPSYFANSNILENQLERENSLAVTEKNEAFSNKNQVLSKDIDVIDNGSIEAPAISSNIDEMGLLENYSIPFDGCLNLWED